MTKSKIEIEFKTNEADEDEGLGNAGIETYRDRPYAGTAREVGQNSRDASASASLPVRINFDLLEIPFEDVPALQTLKNATSLCLAKAHAANDAKEIAHFEQATRVLETGPLKVLRISDYNTLGLRGPAVAKTPFHSLIKGSGVSVKENDTSGGSFGIGKMAVFAISDIQTVLYSTVWQDTNGQKQFLAQGRAVLVSHHDENGNHRHAAAYWGVPKFKPIDNQADAPEWLRRSEVGTSVFALGFREMPNWQYRIAYALLVNFFHAVNSGEMEFAINGGSIVISRLSLASLFDDPNIIAEAKEDDRDQEFALARQHYECLVSADAKEKVVSVPGLGKVLIRVLVAEGLPKKVCIIRNGMVITDNLENFGDSFSRFSMYREFVAVVVPLEPEGRTLIKRLENPKHDGLSAERLPDEAERKRARNIMKKLAKAIRDTIKSYSLIEYDRKLSVDEMQQYFAAEADKQTSAQKSQQEDPNTLRYNVEPRRTRTATSATSKGKGTGGGPKPGPRPGPRPGPGPGPGPRPPREGVGTTGKSRVIALHDVRNIARPDKGARARAIFFTPEEGGMAVITLQASGINESDNLEIVSASDATVKDGSIRRQVNAKERTRIDVEFSEDYTGPIEMSVSIQPLKEAANEA